MIIYVEIELKKKVDLRTIFSKSKEDRMEYVKIDILDNFSFFQQNVRVGSVLDTC